MAKKTVPVTSVTPKAKVKASTEKEKASTRKTIGMIASVFAPSAAGAKIGSVAGKAVLRGIAKEARPAVIKSANVARGSGKMITPKAPSGVKVKTAAKRDVVVKTDDKVIPIKNKGYINKTGEKSIKTNTNNPTVRSIDKGTTRKQANQQTSSFNKMRYGASKKEADRGSAAIQRTKGVPNAGKKIGAVSGAAAGAAGVSAKKKKSK